MSWSTKINSGKIFNIFGRGKNIKNFLYQNIYNFCLKST